MTDQDTVADPATVADSELNSDRSGHETVTDPATPKETLKRPKKETRGGGIPPCPHTEIIEIYHELLPELPSVVSARWQGSARARDLKARWREDERHRNPEFWRWFFGAVRANQFWLGENDRGWRANLGWLVNRSNFDKVIEHATNEQRQA